MTNPEAFCTTEVALHIPAGSPEGAASRLEAQLTEAGVDYDRILNNPRRRSSTFAGEQEQYSVQATFRRPGHDAEQAAADVRQALDAAGLSEYDVIGTGRGEPAGLELR